MEHSALYLPVELGVAPPQGTKESHPHKIGGDAVDVVDHDKHHSYKYLAQDQQTVNTQEVSD